MSMTIPLITDRKKHLLTRLSKFYLTGMHFVSWNYWQQPVCRL